MLFLMEKIMEENEKPKSWIGRNWIWAAPIGCLGSLLLFGGFIALILMFVFSMMKSSDVYKDAFATAQNSVEVQEALGTPITAGLFITGNINISGDTGIADLRIPISGPSGDGTIILKAHKKSNHWDFEILEVDISHKNKTIDLLDDTHDE